MERPKRENGNGMEVDAKVLASIEQSFLQDYLFFLNKADQAEVNFASFRLDTLRAISSIPSPETRVNSWKVIEQIDKGHSTSEVYQRAVWVLELLEPPIKSKGENTHVVLFLYGKGSSYVGDGDGNVRAKIAKL